MPVGFVIIPGSDATEEVDAQLEEFVNVLEIIYADRHSQVNLQGWEDKDVITLINEMNRQMQEACDSVTKVIELLAAEGNIELNQKAALTYKQNAKYNFQKAALTLVNILEGIEK